MKNAKCKTKDKTKKNKKAWDGEKDKGKLLKLRQSLHKLVKIGKQL